MRRRPEREFYFRLAGHLGMTVAELLARISSRELTEWAVYERRAGPLGGRRGDIQAAIVAADVYNVNRKKGAKPVDPEKLLPTWDDYQSDDQMWAAIRQANAAMGGTEAD
ncbi:MAG: hypothetical protein CW348_14160 [Thermobifida sp.]|jgi:hypothetical protein|nr:hypothetical protein [Thermobifida fusca]MBO2530966.1 hypothetical protein [Thermobifida sp.]